MFCFENGDETSGIHELHNKKNTGVIAACGSFVQLPKNLYINPQVYIMFKTSRASIQNFFSLR
jgi:hypothetical protein